MIKCFAYHWHNLTAYEIVYGTKDWNANVTDNGRVLKNGGRVLPSDYIMIRDRPNEDSLRLAPNGQASIWLPKNWTTVR